MCIKRSGIYVLVSVFFVLAGVGCGRDKAIYVSESYQAASVYLLNQVGHARTNFHWYMTYGTNLFSRPIGYAYTAHLPPIQCDNRGTIYYFGDEREGSGTREVVFKANREAGTILVQYNVEKQDVTTGGFTPSKQTFQAVLEYSYDAANYKVDPEPLNVMAASKEIVPADEEAGSTVVEVSYDILSDFYLKIGQKEVTQARFLELVQGKTCESARKFSPNSGGDDDGEDPDDIDQGTSSGNRIDLMRTFLQ